MSHLKAGCSHVDSRLQPLSLAYACYQWVVTHVKRPPIEDTWDVDAPLFDKSHAQNSQQSPVHQAEAVLLEELIQGNCGSRGVHTTFVLKTCKHGCRAVS